MASIESEHYMVGEIRLFDGTAHRFATDAEEHLLSKLSHTDDPAFIWDRLGNLYSKGERPELAAAAYERAIRLDRRQSESYFSLTQLFREIGGNVQAADFYRKTLSSAPYYKQMKAEAFRQLLAVAIQDLKHIHLDSDKSIPFLPERDELAEMYMGKRRDELISHKMATKAKSHRETAAGIESVTSFSRMPNGKEDHIKKKKVRHKGKWSILFVPTPRKSLTKYSIASFWFNPSHILRRNKSGNSRIGWDITI